MARDDAALDSSPTARRIIVGAQLRRLREAAEVPPAEAARAIRGSESKISRMELGRVALKERDIEDLLTLYGVHDEAERAHFLQLVAESRQPGWWNRYADSMPQWFQDYVGLEGVASRIQTYELQFVPGLLQIEDYALALASSGHPALADEDARRRVALRMKRQSVLARPGAPRLWAVIDESVLHRPIGGVAVMRAQIDHLLEMTRHPNIALQVVPFALSGYAAEGSFTVLRFAEPELPDIVYLEHLSGALYLDKREEIERYSRTLDRLMVDARTPEQTRQMLRKVRASL
ncbi:helix-turn-helix domain-containing protein [Saccharopolyspora hordei]|uniref:Transcriptional regulator with XRE-family HTH domain n=1 Tax=Saccharopolyspora hordei TaxID=1838 RepID=A0A853ASX5_9PSEU|nr:helix-turn-helix transcriptional regulator [Saccharopolyspora hordei]NYI85527.1 transcriptional regulator with XRE-family HTH domain [Saccharopolyspora hordei]